MSSARSTNEIVALAIAGFDPSGGAGVIVDVQTFLAFGCASSAAITSITYQNAERVFGADHLSAVSLRAQIEAVSGERRVAAVKTGMLPTREIVCEVAGLVREGKVPAPVVDPVLRSSSGYALMNENAIELLLTNLMPLARLITPNIPEAERLTGLRINDEAGMREAATRLRAMGARAVLIKGGHLNQVAESEAIDVLDDGGEVTVFRREWIDAPPVRGTGCRLSAAIAAGLARGFDLKSAVDKAKEFVGEHIAQHALLSQHTS